MPEGSSCCHGSIGLLGCRDHYSWDPREAAPVPISAWECCRNSSCLPPRCTNLPSSASIAHTGIKRKAKARKRANEALLRLPFSSSWQRFDVYTSPALVYELQPYWHDFFVAPFSSLIAVCFVISQGQLQLKTRVALKSASGECGLH